MRKRVSLFVRRPRPPQHNTVLNSQHSEQREMQRQRQQPRLRDQEQTERQPRCTTHDRWALHAATNEQCGDAARCAECGTEREERIVPRQPAATQTGTHKNRDQQQQRSSNKTEAVQAPSEQKGRLHTARTLSTSTNGTARGQKGGTSQARTHMDLSRNMARVTALSRSMSCPATTNRCCTDCTSAAPSPTTVRRKTQTRGVSAAQPSGISIQGESCGEGGSSTGTAEGLLGSERCKRNARATRRDGDSQTTNRRHIGLHSCQRDRDRTLKYALQRVGPVHARRERDRVDRVAACDHQPQQARMSKSRSQQRCLKAISGVRETRGAAMRWQRAGEMRDCSPVLVLVNGVQPRRIKQSRIVVVPSCSARS